MTAKISSLNLVAQPALWQRLLLPVLDKILGIAKMNQLYHQHNMQGLSKEAFVDKLLDLQNIDVANADSVLAQIPPSGPIVIASNHPFGGIEGVILSRLIARKRPDLKVFANQGLKVFKELESFFIFTNPLSPNDPKNAPSIRQALAHVKAGKPLLIFPAGRVSYYRPEYQSIAEHEWNKLVAALTQRAQGNYLGLFVQGVNRKRFYTAGRIHDKLKMFFLPRELLAKTGETITINHTNALNLPSLHGQSGADLARALSYAVDADWAYTWPADKATALKPLAESIAPDVLETELANLPAEQKLCEVNDFAVYWSMQAQTPNIVDEIARCRERVFRMHNEGSGEPRDTDKFDATYTQLYIWHKSERQIIGAYRMGRTDKLIEQDGLSGLYLHKMFEFAPEFVNRQRPCLEMGRSFIIPEYQRSPQGLYMLWRGIGEFINAFPQYSTLYGTVSISKLYTPQSVSIIENGLIDRPLHVSPRHQFELDLHQQINAFAKQYGNGHVQSGLSEHVSTFLAAIEKDGKDIPVLAKQYHKLGAHFHALGIDTSFNHTPGLLLSVDISMIPARMQKRYLGRVINVES